MSETPTLMCRNGVWVFRRAVPAKIRPFLKKREWLESLHTKDKAEAKVRVKAVGVKVDRIFEAAWRKHFAIVEHPEQLADHWKEDALRSDLEIRTSGPQRSEEMARAEVEVLEEAIQRHEQALAEQDYSVVNGLVADALREHGISELPPEAMRSLSRAMLMTHLESLRLVLTRASGLSSERLEVSPGVTEEDLPLSVILERWKAERHPPSQTWHEWQAVFQRFKEMNGSDLPVKSITRSHVRAFKDALLRAPRRIPHSLRGRPFPEVLTTATEGPRLSAQSINKALSAIAGVLAWAMKQGYVEQNVAVGLKPDIRREAEERRRPYSLEDLKSIFASLTLNPAKPANYWLPLLGAWTGCRLAELGQLLVTDVREEDGIWYLDIRGGDGKSIKTASSRRRVPLHSKIIEGGFLDHVKGQNGPNVFPDLRADVHGRITGRWSKWWARYTTSIGITDSRLVYHSFRHSFASACRKVGMPLEIQEKLMGHSSGRVSAGYGETYPLKVLAEAIERISYE